MSNFRYDDDNNFYFVSDAGHYVLMEDGKLSIADVEYEVHEDDMIYPLMRQLVKLLVEKREREAAETVA